MNDVVFHSKAGELLAELLPLEPALRRPRLASLTGISLSIREEVEALLDWSERDVLSSGQRFSFPDDELETTQSAELLPALEAQRFRIEREIGRGAFGVVYLAEQHLPRRLVALKAPHRRLLSRNASKQLLAEAHVLATLDHPGIVRVFSSSMLEDGETPFLALEYCNGQPLSEALAERPLDAAEAEAILIKLCEAVAHAHALGVVHRDIKPSNIMLRELQGTPTRAPMLIDFGIARCLDEGLLPAAVRTLSNGFLGSLLYMAPERLDGPREDVGSACDVYSLGIVALRLFGAVSDRQLADHIAQGQRALELGRSAIPRRLRPTLHAMLDPAASKRPTMSEALDSLRNKCYWAPFDARPGARTLVATSLTLLTAGGIGAYAWSASDRTAPSETHTGIALPSAELFSQDRHSLLMGAFRSLGYHTTGVQMLHEIAKKRGKDDPEWAKLMLHASMLARQVGDYPVARQLIDEYTAALAESEVADPSFELIILAREIELLGIDAPPPFSFRDIETFAADPSTTATFRFDAYRAIGGHYYVTAQYEKALANLERALAEIPDIPRSDRALNNAVDCENSRGVVLRALGQLDESARIMRSSLPQLETVRGSDSPDTLRVRGNLALTYYLMGEFEESLKQSSLVLELGPDESDGLPTFMSSTYGLRGLALCATGRLEEGLPLLDRAMDRFEKIREDGAPDSIVALLYREASARAHAHLDPSNETLKSQVAQAQADLLRMLPEGSVWSRSFGWF